MPVEPKLSGLAAFLAYATNSSSVFTGKSLRTAIAIGV